MVRFFTFSGALFHLFRCAFLSFSKKVKKRTKKDIILKNYLVRSVRLVRLVRFFILLYFLVKIDNLELILGTFFCLLMKIILITNCTWSNTFHNHGNNWMHLIWNQDALSLCLPLGIKFLL